MNNIVVLTDLVPCPFCGHHRMRMNNDWGMVWVSCLNCGASGQEFSVETDDGVVGAEARAKAHWNRRVST